MIDKLRSLFLVTVGTDASHTNTEVALLHFTLTSQKYDKHEEGGDDDDQCLNCCNAMWCHFRSKTWFNCTDKELTGLLSLCSGASFLSASPWGSKLHFPNMRSISTTQCFVWPCSGLPAGSLTCPVVSMRDYCF